MGGQHDGHLTFWLPGFVEFIMLKLYVFVCIAEINILLLAIYSFTAINWHSTSYTFWNVCSSHINIASTVYLFTLYTFHCLSQHWLLCLYYVLDLMWCRPMGHQCPTLIHQISSDASLSCTDAHKLLMVSSCNSRKVKKKKSLWWLMMMLMMHNLFHQI